MYPHVNIHNLSTRSHPSEEENSRKNCKYKQAFRDMKIFILILTLQRMTKNSLEKFQPCLVILTSSIPDVDV